MREIKFRAWDKKNKIMIYGLSEYAAETATTRPINDYEIMQFTGLLDKNGKEIYEGDIIRFPTSDKNAKKEIEMLKITLEEVRIAEETEKTEKKFQLGNGAFDGGSQGQYRSYWLSHKSNITTENPTGSLSGVIEKRIKLLEIPARQIIEWKGGWIDDGCGCCGTSFIGFELSSEEEKEIIGNIYQNPDLLSSNMKE